MLCRGVLGGGGGATGLLNKGGGGSNRLPGQVNNKLWNFYRYRLVYIIILDPNEGQPCLAMTPWLTPYLN